MSKTICNGTKTVLDNRVKSRKATHHFTWWMAQAGMRPYNVKRMRLVCPECGRRVVASVKTCHDGCCIYQYIPPHKPKGWWRHKRPKWLQNHHKK